MHQLQSIINQVDKTHPRLGNVVAMLVLITKASKCMLIVSPSGCGKSAAGEIAHAALKNVIRMDGISMTGLASVAQSWENFEGLVLVDDIAKNQTAYSRKAAITTVAELCYSHYVERYFRGAEVSLSHFYGGSVINVQPVMLRELVMSSEWEASVQDKTLRYYHIYRPLEPNLDLPQVTVDMGIKVSVVSPPNLKAKLANELLLIGQIQWSRARVRQHIIDLLKALAALDSRNKVTQVDYRLLLKLLRAMVIEKYAIAKSQFESGRKLNAGGLAILTEFATYGNFSAKQVSLDYKISESTFYRLMSYHQDDWVVVAKNPTIYGPSERMKDNLKELGLD